MIQDSLKYSIWHKVNFVIGKKTKLFALIPLFVLASFLDLLSVGLLAPFTYMLSSPDVALKNKKIAYLVHFFPGMNQTQFMWLFAGIILFVFLMNGLLGFLSHRLACHLSFQKGSELIGRLMRRYQKAPYSFHLKENSANLLNVMTVTTIHFIEHFVLSAVRLISNSMVIIFLLILLAFVNWIATLIIFGIISLIILFNKCVIKPKRKLAQDSAFHVRSRMMRYVREAIRGYKEIHILGHQAFFQSLVEQDARAWFEETAVQETLIVVPKYCAEFGLVLFILVFSMLSFLKGQNSGALFASISVFVVALIRLLPSTKQVSQDLAELQHDKQDLEAIFDCLTIVQCPEESSRDSINKKMEAFNELFFSDVSFSFSSSDQSVLRSLSFSLLKGEIIGFVGSSGAGKTTLLNIILGLLPISSGMTKINGKIEDLCSREWQERLAYIPQDIFLMDASIAQNIALGVEIDKIDLVKVEQVLKQVDLWNLVSNFPEGLETLVGEDGGRLSGGQRQRIGIARALYFEKEILILDEITAALDSQVENQIMRLINSLKGDKTILVVAHRFSTLSGCDRIYQLQQGQVIGVMTYQELITRHSSGT